MRDQELFERFEPDRAEGFYTVNFQKQILSFEYNMAVQGTLFRFYVYEKSDPKRIIGTISFHHIVRGFSNSCEIGYKFSSEVHHRGYATEALTKVLEVIFYELQLHRVQAWVLPDNIPSIRLLNRVGFVFEGISRDYLFLHGTSMRYTVFFLRIFRLQAGITSSRRFPRTAARYLSLRRLKKDHDSNPFVPLLLESSPLALCGLCQLQNH